MAVGIDNVYQQVLAIANKEQRGYITPQEFNLFARKAQLDIFENTFHDYKMAMLKPQTQVKLVDDIEMIKDKIGPFRVTGSTMSGGNTVKSYETIVHWLENVYVPTANSVRTVTITLTSGASVYNNATSTINLRAYYSGDGGQPAGEGEYKLILDSDGNPNTSNQADNNFISIDTNLTATQVATKVKDYLNDRSPYHSATSANEVVTVTYLQDGSLISGTETLGSFTSSATIAMGTATTTASSPVTMVFEEVNRQDWYNTISGGAKLRPTAVRPVYYRKAGRSIEVYPSTELAVLMDYIKKPDDPRWTYVVTNGKALYNGSDANLKDFQIHASEEGSLVNKILELAGISMKKPALSEVAIRNEQLNETDKNN